LRFRFQGKRRFWFLGERQCVQHESHGIIAQAIHVAFATLGAFDDMQSESFLRGVGVDRGRKFAARHQRLLPALSTATPMAWQRSKRRAPDSAQVAKSISEDLDQEDYPARNEHSQEGLR
jgi:hypothetical protein